MRGGLDGVFLCVMTAEDIPAFFADRVRAAGGDPACLTVATAWAAIKDVAQARREPNGEHDDLQLEITANEELGVWFVFDRMITDDDANYDGTFNVAIGWRPDRAPDGVRYTRHNTCAGWHARFIEAAEADAVVKRILELDVAPSSTDYSRGLDRLG